MVADARRILYLLSFKDLRMEESPWRFFIHYFNVLY